MPTRVAVIYYSATGNVHEIADAIAEGARQEGAEVRVRRVAEIAPEAVIRENEEWHAHHQATKDAVEEATLDDLEWADGIAFGTPTRFGNPAAQLKQFIDTAGGLWSEGRLADKAATSFTSASTEHGGQESTILALNNVFYHWGSIIIPPGYTDERLDAAGGNPYGTSFASGQDGADPDSAVLTAGRIQGARLARVAAALANARASA